MRKLLLILLFTPIIGLSQDLEDFFCVNEFEQGVLRKANELGYNITKNEWPEFGYTFTKKNYEKMIYLPYYCGLDTIFYENNMNPRREEILKQQIIEHCKFVEVKEIRKNAYFNTYSCKSSSISGYIFRDGQRVYREPKKDNSQISISYGLLPYKYLKNESRLVFIISQ